MQQEGLAIGARARQLRQQQGLTLTALAKRAGISKAYLSQLENDPGKKPSAEVVVQLARALNIPVTELMGIQAEESPDHDELPVGLKVFWGEHPELPLEDIRMLAGLHYRGRRPITATDYWLIYETVKAATTRRVK